MQYRDKTASSEKLLEISRELSGTLVRRGVTFFVNDRADIARIAGASGVHVGQQDLGVEQARRALGGHGLVGISTHNMQQFEEALDSSADYIALGPIFSTSSKANPDPVVGTEFIRQARPRTRKPMVAIGGITLERASEVLDAGADSLAVISDILRAAEPAARAEQYMKLLGDVNPMRQD